MRGCNSGIVDLGDHTLIFDTSATLGSARELRRIAESLTGRPASYVINSHPHPDHFNGNLVFADHAALISSVATKTYLEASGADRIENMRISMTAAMEDCARQLAEAREQAGDEEKVSQLHAMHESFKEFFETYPTAEDLRLPDVTFERAHAIQGSTRRVELLTFGRAHSVCDGVMWLPEDNILFIADLVIPGDNLTLPTNEPANPDDWAGILDQCEALGADVLVPGHRRLATAAEGFAWARQYLQHVYALAEEAVEAGKTPDHADELTVPAPYRANTYRKNVRFLMERRLAKQQQI